MVRVEVEDWSKRAACHRSFDRRFFGSDVEQEKMRSMYCVGCAVVAECGMFAESVGEQNGMWGGKKR